MSLAESQADSATMAGMTPPRHAPVKPARTPGLGAAWAVLIGMGVASVTFNVVHAVQGARLEIGLALLLGIAPVYGAAFLSHVAAVLDAHWVVKAAVTAVMLGGMVLSASATAAVVQPADPGWRGWLLGCVLDAAALLALWAIMASRRRNNAAIAAAEAARAEADLATRRAGELEAELEAVRAELEAELQGLRSALTDALTKRERSAPKRARRSAPVKAARSAVPRDVDTQAEGLRILAEEPGIGGQELGRRLGKSESYGCRLKKKLAGSVTGPED